jgi:2-phosphoglycerate kinase
VEIKIEKRSGRIEDFNEDKIVRSVTRAGAKPAIAKQVLVNVRQRLESKGSTLVKSATLKEYAREELEKMTPNIAKTYWEYMKPAKLEKTKGVGDVRQRQAKIRSKKTGQYDKPRA